MIKINLLKAMKQMEENAGQKGSDGLGGFLGKLFPPKASAAEDDFDDESEEDGEPQPIQLLLKLVVVFLPAAALFYFQSMNIPKLEEDRDEQTKIVDELEAYNNRAAASVAEIKKQKEHKVLIERQIASLGGLSKVRLKYVRVLDLIQQNLPQKMWFRSLKSTDNKLEATGISHSEQEITQFLEMVSKSIYFSDVSMVSSEDIQGPESEGRRFKKFTLNFLLESNK